jgi:hypothetical protein
VISVGGRLGALEPSAGESAESYRARVEPLTHDAGAFEAARLSFESFLGRLESALRAAIPDATVVINKAESRLVKAPERAVSAPEQTPREPTHRGYDPFPMYYPSPMGVMLDAMIFSSFMHMMMPPSVMVVSPMGMPIAPLEQIQGNPELASDLSVAEHDRAAALNDDLPDPEASGDSGESLADGDGDGGGGDDHDSGWFDDSSNGGGWDDGGGGFDGGGGLD